MVQPTVHFRPALSLPLAFVLSACSLMYQQILVYALFDVGGNFVLTQSLGLGAFLLGMGLGTWRTVPATLTRLIVVEFSLALLGFLSVFLIYIGEVLLRYFYSNFPPEKNFMIFLPLVIMVGFFTGQEVPLLMRLSPGAKPAQILGWTYLGGLLSLVSLPLLLLPLLDLPKLVFIVALINFSLAYFLLWKHSSRRWPQVFALMFAALLVPWLKFEPIWRELHLKYIYFPVAYTNSENIERDWDRYAEMDSPIRLRSAYQWLDILPAGLTRAGGEENAFSLYLDRKFQLNALTQRRYHEGLVEGGINLLGRVPERVLILGGGDGLLLPYLLKHRQVKHVDLVELDGAVLDLAIHNRELAQMNEGLLKDPRVQVHRGDGFAFTRRSHDSYEMILIDFPLPTSYELSLLYTREFYAFVHARLTPDGIMLMDFAWPDKKLEALSVLLATLKAAEFRSPLGFGQEDLFLAMARDGRELKFNYDDIAKSASNQSLLSFTSQQQFLNTAATKRPVRVNSLFFPYLFDFQYAENR